MESTVSPKEHQPAAGKSCGTCTLCCKLIGITELQKPQGVWCAHCTPGKGCGIYEQRPDSCKHFFCMWLMDSLLGPEWKPSHSKFMITPYDEGNGLVIHCDAGYPLAWRREPYLRQIRVWSAAFRKTDGLVLVCVGRDTIVIAPEGEFPVGVLKDDDQIISEFDDSRLVRVRLARQGNP